LFLHAGDIFSSSNPITVHHTGECNFRALNLIGFDALTPGNGEFYWGVEFILKRAKEAKFPVLHADLAYRETRELLFEPYSVKEVNGVRVGILGLGVIRKEHPKAKPLVLRHHVVTAREYVPLLREQADLVIVLSHLGTDFDRQIATSVPGVNIIVGGHNHDVFEEPMRIAGPDGNEVALTRAGDYWRFVGRLDVVMEKEEEGQPWRVKHIEGKMIPVTEETPEDPAVRDLVAEYSEPLQEVLCIARSALENPEEGYSEVGHLVATAALWATGVDAALIDRGAVRSPIEAGLVPLGIVYRIHPWRNEIMLVELSGADLLALMEEQPGLHCGACGFKWSNDPTSFYVRGHGVQPEKKYRIAITDYLCATAKTLKGKEAQPTGRMVHEALEQYLRTQETIETLRALSWME
jgi:2',3'-cyclic-nucleotide 2'-phosphodiesterase (5'-nucleotidase family)